MNTHCQKQHALSPVPGEFAQPLPADILNIADKRRANAFAWRGQFSPQLVESLLRAYCPTGYNTITETEIQTIAQSIALQELNRGLPIVSEKNRADILDAIKNIDTITGTPIFCQ